MRRTNKIYCILLLKGNLYALIHLLLLFSNQLKGALSQSCQFIQPMLERGSMDLGKKIDRRLKIEFGGHSSE